MTTPTPAGRSWLRPPAYLIALVALLLAFGGGATAAKLIDGKNIKKNTVTGKQIKDDSLRLKDFKRSERAALAGPAGPAGATGASGFGPPPSGTLVTGAGLYSDSNPGTGTDLRYYVPLGFSTAADLSEEGPGRNLWLGAGGTVSNPAEVNTTACPGSALAPSAAPGVLCVYPIGNFGVLAPTLRPVPGASGAAGVRLGFTLVMRSTSGGTTTLPFVWAYRAA